MQSCRPPDLGCQSAPQATLPFVLVHVVLLAHDMVYIIWYFPVKSFEGLDTSAGKNEANKDRICEVDTLSNICITIAWKSFYMQQSVFTT